MREFTSLAASSVWPSASSPIACGGNPATSSKEEDEEFEEESDEDEGELWATSSLRSATVWRRWFRVSTTRRPSLRLTLNLAVGSDSSTSPCSHRDGPYASCH